MENTESLGINDVADAFLKRWNTDVSETEAIRSEEKENTTDNSEVEADDVHNEPSEADTDEADVNEDQTDTDAEDESEAVSAKIAEDDAVVKVSVDGKEQEFKVADLKRLAGQEQKLNRLGEEAAARRKALEEDGARYVAATETLLKRAAERYAPYQNIDWAEAAATLDPEDYRLLKTKATEAYQEIQFLSSELDAFMGHVQQQRQKALVEEAKATLAELTDKERGIPGFNESVYNEMRQFAVSQGIPVDVVNTLVSAPALRIIHAAMMHHKGKSVETTKVVKTPKQVVKSRTNVETTRKVSSAPADKAMSQLKQTGSVDDVKAALLSRWQNKNQD